MTGQSKEKSSSVKKQQREQEKEDSKRILQRTDGLLADIDNLLGDTRAQTQPIVPLSF